MKSIRILLAAAALLAAPFIAGCAFPYGGGMKAPVPVPAALAP
jgi:hypothetical protein